MTFIWHLNATEFVLRSDVDLRMPEAPSPELTKVVWWNLGCSSTLLLGDMEEDQRVNFSPESSWENLKSLIESEYEPDVLILGEYCPKDFDHPTYEVLAEHYAHIHRVVKSNPHFRKRNGLRVFSKYPFSVKKELTLTDGDFASVYLEDLCTGEVNTSDRVWSRHLSLLEIRKPDQSFTLAPVHFANPWRSVARCTNAFQTWAEIHRSESNINYLQSRDLLRVIDEETPTLIIGDFNAPKRGGLFLDSRAYKELKDNYGPSLIYSSDPTYIDKTGDYPNSSIDHAFSLLLDQKYGELLPLSGSDHLPIMVAF